jgi:hypothetical protein
MEVRDYTLCLPSIDRLADAPFAEETTRSTRTRTLSKGAGTCGHFSLSALSSQ